MRVLFWCETFWPRIGGVENLAANLLPALRARGHEFIVITWAHSEGVEEVCYEGIPVYRFPFFARAAQNTADPLTEHLRHVARLKRDFAPELVHINSYGRSAFFHLMTASARRAPVLLSLHQALPDEHIQRDSVLGKLLHTADWITAVSAAVLAHAGELVPRIIPRSSLIYNAVRMPAMPARRMSFDTPRLLFLGRLVREKGLDWALTELVAVFRRHKGARLMVGGDGPERKRLEQQTVDLNLVDSVEFLGSVPYEDVPSLIDEATLVLIPSRTEGFGLVALEAALMGRPVVATRVGGLPEIVVHNRTGLLVDRGESGGFAEAVAYLLDHQTVALRMGREASDYATEKFSWQRYVDAYDSLYRDLMH